MAGYHNGAQASNEGGKQRLKPPGSTKPETNNNEKPAASARRPRSTFLGNHWGKALLGTAAAVLVGSPLLVSHVQLNEEHPEFSPLSMQGIAQRAYRTAGHLTAMATAAWDRSEPSFKNLSDSFSLSHGTTLPDYAVVCYDRELLARAAEGHPHARAYVRAAENLLTVQMERLSSKDTPFYKEHVSWDPDMPIPAAALTVDYNKFWYPESDVFLRAPRPVTQWIAEGGGGCPDSTKAEIRKLSFKPQ